MSRSWFGRRAPRLLGRAGIFAGVLAAFAWPGAAQGLFPGGDPAYGDSADCAECHAEIARTYARTGMARSFGALSPDRLAGTFPEGSLAHGASEQFFTMSRRDGRAFVRRHLKGPAGAPSEIREVEAAYWLGSGNHARGFVARTSADELRALPVTWYAAEGGFWGMSPNYDRATHPGFDRAVDYRCLFCHAGYPDIEPGGDVPAAGRRYPGRLVEGIDCQRCHGPGRAHVEAARRADPPQAVRGAIVNPARLSPERSLEICLQCHLETTSAPLPGQIIRFDRGAFSYRPGEPLGEWAVYFDYAPGSRQDDRFDFVSSAYRLRQSACFIGADAMTCTTCHDPHDAPRGAEAVRRYARACRECHAAKLDALIQDAAHSESLDCAGCHMPKRRASDAPLIRVADHRIQRRPEPDAPLLDEQPYRGVVAPRYPPEFPRAVEDELYLATAQVADQANLEVGVERLDALLRANPTLLGEFHLQAGQAWMRLGRIDKGGPRLVEAARRMPRDWRPLQALGSALASVGQFDRAIQVLRGAASTAPREAAPRLQLGAVHAETGALNEAVVEYRAAIERDPESAQARNGLGAVLLELGDAESAEAALSEAVRLRPELPVLRGDLALALSLNGKFLDACHHFERALRLDPSFVEGRVAYARVLAGRALWAEARKQYEQALRLAPNRAASRRDLAAVLLRLGETEAAIRELAESVRIEPNDYETRLTLARLHAAAGRRRAAAPHIAKALESPDAEIRRAAEALAASDGR